MSEDKLVAKLIRAREKRDTLQEEIDDITGKLNSLRLKEYPSEPGWYEDADGQIARLCISRGNKYFDDGWDHVSGEDGYPLPTLPLTRLMPVE